jgi:4-amino-4-deoxy-L-arabinose transferase-like glycosyltransferase
MNGAAPFPAHYCRLTLLAVVALLLVHFVLAVGSKLRECTTTDELVHLTAGVSYWQNNDYRLHPENGIFPQRWAALPAWLGQTKFPQLTGNDYWRTSDVWKIGYQYFYETGQDHFPWLMAGRTMIALFSVATGVLVFCWSRQLFGNAGALVSLILFTFCPTFLAHGALVTSDVCAAFFFLAATGAWWRHLHDGRARIWWLSALTLGLAFVTKYSAILLLPMMVLMAAIRALAPEPLVFGRRIFSTRAAKFGAAALSATGHALVVALMIWAFYGFRYSAFNPLLPPADHFIRPWAVMEEPGGISVRVIHTLANLRALPEGFLYGFVYVLKTVATRAAFLNGDYSVTGWPTFFPWAFLLKTTVPLLLICALVAGQAARRCLASNMAWRRNLYRVTPLITLFAVYWLASLTSHLNIGHRHLLPIYPVLFIGAGALGVWMTSRRWTHVTAVIVLLGWQVIESVRIAPHYLAYFNQLAGGPENGWRHLVDSSLDWGQDLPGLKSWLTMHGSDEPVFLSYFGAGEPDYYGINVTRMPFLDLFSKPNPWYEPKAGWYCISATLLQQVYSPFKSDWQLAWEKEYQEGRQKEPLFKEYWRNPQVRESLQRIGAAGAFENTWIRYDRLRFARLCLYLRARGPDANIGYSLLLFHLNAVEVAGATTGKWSDLHDLIETITARKP